MIIFVYTAQSQQTSYIHCQHFIALTVDLWSQFWQWCLYSSFFRSDSLL